MARRINNFLRSDGHSSALRLSVDSNMRMPLRLTMRTRELRRLHVYPYTLPFVNLLFHGFDSTVVRGFRGDLFEEAQRAVVGGTGGGTLLFGNILLSSIP